MKNKIYPREGDRQTVYLKEVVSDPNIEVGEWTIYNDFAADLVDFERNNVLYHYPVNGDRLVIGRFCSLACGARFLFNSANHTFGYAFDEEHEANGVSFYGVGNGTTVEHLQAYMGSDDGFEFFGGSVNVKYMVATNCSDDSFDWTEGWNGKAQFLVAYQENAETLGYDCDCLMECDNNGNNFGATPVAHPVIANVTLVGNGGSKQGVRLRAGTQVELYNAIITGKGQPLTVETVETENALKDGTSKLEYVVISDLLNSKENIYTNDLFAAGNGNATQHTANLSDLYVGTEEGGKDLSADEFFTATNYKGAVQADDNWTAGWTL